MMKRTWTVSCTLALVSAVFALGLSLGNAAQPSERAQEGQSVDELLREMEIDMASIAEHAAKLEQMVRLPAKYTTTSHEFEWNGIRARINEAGELIPKLQSATEDAPTWRKDVIDHISSLLKAMEVQIESGIEMVGEATAGERLGLNNLYAVRARSVRHYANHIDDLIELAEDREEPTS